MAMSFYNPKREKENAEPGPHGSVEIRVKENPSKKELFVTTEGKTKKGKENYIVDGFKNKTGYTFYETDENGVCKKMNIKKEPDLWYSFDPAFDKGNFHIVPKGILS